MNRNIADHYEAGNLSEVIDQGLTLVTGGSRKATIDDLAPVDEFHIGGRQASIHLFEQLNISADDKGLDVGAGIGGTARFVANKYGAKVEGIDLTPEFCEVAAYLTDLVGMTGRVNVRRGSALDLPYDDNSFTFAYMMHVGMNIEDKPTLYSEVRRVLQAGGTFAVYDVMAGAASGRFRYPVPWATTSEESFLETPDAVQAKLVEAGFTVHAVTDRTDFAIEFFQTALAAASDGPSAIGLHQILGTNAREKLTNMVGNVKDGLCGPWEIIATA